jgi:hypothetical protein
MVGFLGAYRWQATFADRDTMIVPSHRPPFAAHTTTLQTFVTSDAHRPVLRRPKASCSLTVIRRVGTSSRRHGATSRQTCPLRGPHSPRMVSPAPRMNHPPDHHLPRHQTLAPRRQSRLLLAGAPTSVRLSAAPWEESRSWLSSASASSSCAGIPPKRTPRRMPKMVPWGLKATYRSSRSLPFSSTIPRLERMPRQTTMDGRAALGRRCTRTS